MTPTMSNPPKKTFTDDERKSIAVGWSKSGLGQTEYAARYGIKPRTLRLWLNEHALTLASAEEIRDTGRHVLDALRRAAALLEEALGQAGDAEASGERRKLCSAEAFAGSPLPTLAVKKFNFD